MKYFSTFRNTQKGDSMNMRMYNHVYKVVLNYFSGNENEKTSSNMDYFIQKVNIYLELTNGKYKPVKTTWWYCGLCGRRFSSKAKLKMHIQRYHETTLNQITYEFLNFFEEFKQSINRSNYKIICLKCGKTFENSINAFIHFAKEHKKI